MVQHISVPFNLGFHPLKSPHKKTSQLQEFPRPLGLNEWGSPSPSKFQIASSTAAAVLDRVLEEDFFSSSHKWSAESKTAKPRGSV